MMKKLRPSVKSLYSHETRKDVNLANLKSLKLEDAWPFIRDEIEMEIGNNDLVCIPHVTEPDIYKASSLFVNNEEGPKGKLFKPIGLLAKVACKKRTSANSMKWLESDDFIDPEYKFPHESVKITLQDEKIKHKVRVIMVNFTRAYVDKNHKDFDKIYLDLEKFPELKKKKSIYMITNVLMAKTIEFRVTIGTSSRIFHLGNASPLVFGIEEFLIEKDGKLVAKEPVKKSKSLLWQRVNSLDQLLSEHLSECNIASCSA